VSNIVPFQFGSHEVRFIIDDHGEPWWEAQTICHVLGIRDVSKAVARLRSKEKQTGSRNLLIINESGLYRLIVRSNKPEAEEFQDWVFGEVLPQIRKTGKYEAPHVQNKSLQMLIDMAVQLDATERLAAEANTKAEQANANALRALETQAFFTVAEYVAFNREERHLPKSDYKAVSDHLQDYCLRQGLPFRRVPIGGKPWQEEYGFHISVWADVFPGWLRRRFAQQNLSVILPRKEP
jgi:prophage antirepressor-like protein